MTPTQKATLDRTMALRSTTATLITIASSFPGTPFSELLKMVAHFNQPPDCLTCRHFTHALQSPLDWLEKDFCSLNGHNNPDQVIKFCAEWDPSPTQKDSK